MPIPTNINRENIFQAMIKINREGITSRREAREWAVNYEGVYYPCKLLISWANIYANGVELEPNPNVFNTYMAQEYLMNLGFIVVAI